MITAEDIRKVLDEKFLSKVDEEAFIKSLKSKWWLELDKP